MTDQGQTHYYGDGCEPPHVIHVGLPIAAAGTIEVGNIIHIERQRYLVVKVGGAAFDMTPVCPDCEA